MHKCIMVKLEGKRKTHKVLEKHVNITKSGGNSKEQGGWNNNLGGGYNNFAKIGILK